MTRLAVLVMLLGGTSCNTGPTVRFSLEAQSESIRGLLEEAEINFELKSIAEINGIDQKKFDLPDKANTLEVFDKANNRVGTIHIPFESINVADSETPIIFLGFQSGTPSILSARVTYQTLPCEPLLGFPSGC